MLSDYIIFSKWIIWWQWKQKQWNYKDVNNRFFELRNDVNKKEIPENENSDKVISIVKKILCFNKKGRGLKILTPKQMLQRLSIALAQV